MSTLQALSCGCSLLVVVMGTMFGVLGTPALAENAPVEARPARRAGERLDEMIISARKREENLQETPLSVSAFSAVALRNGDILRADDLQRFTPNLRFEQSLGSQNAASVQIRGVGNADFIPTRDNGVGIYVDGVYLARSQGQLLGLADVERVEVLRGPQGTLFGRNTIGGAINFITRKPGDEFEATGSARVGNLNRFESRASVNLPLAPEKAALLLSFQSVSREGYTKNRQNGQETDDRRLLGVRAALRLNPTEDLELLFTGDQTRSHQSGRGGECRYNRDAFATAPVTQIQQLSGVAFIQECLANQANDEFTYASPLRSQENLDSYGLTSQITWEVGELTLKSLSSWQRQENELRADVTFADVVGVHVGASNHAPFGVLDIDKDQNDQVSQEFNLSGEALGGRLNYTAGLYGFYEKTTPALTSQLAGFNLCQSDPTTLVFPAALEAALLPLFGLSPGTPLPPAAKQLAICMGSSIGRGPRISTSAYAGYGQATYDLTERLHLTGGLRYSRERKDFRFMQMNFITPDTLIDAFAATPIGSRAERFDKWTPMATVSYDVADESIVYASYSRGFKSGGFNGRPNASVPASLLPFDQEVLDNYEIGYKTTAFDSRLQANLAVFYGRYDDIQTTVLGAGSAGQFASRVANAGEAVIRGGELEVRALPLPGLDLRVGLGFTDAEYREFDDVVRHPDPNVTSLIPISRRGEEFINTPNFTGTFSAAYTLYDFAGLGDVTTRLSWYHQNEVNYGPQSDTLEQGKYGLLSGQIALTLPDGKTQIGVFGENLLDRRYVNGGLNFEDGFALSDAYFGPPRLYGIEIRREF
jgi:iron complex outermembrane recepter protein